MRKYEIAVIINPDVDDRQVNGLLEKPLDVFSKAGGTVDNIDVWGRRRLAYEINKKSEGIYAVVDFTSTSATANELDRQLNLSEAVMRTKVLRAEEAIARVASEAKRDEARKAAKAAAAAKPAATTEA